MIGSAIAVILGWVTFAAVPVAQSARDAEQELLAKLPGRIVQSVPVTKDCMVLAYIPQWKFGSIDNIAIANNDGGVRTLMAWKPLPRKATSAKNRRVLLAIYSQKTTVGGKSGAIQIRPLKKDWPEITSWETQPDVNDSVQSVVTPFGEGGGWKPFDITIASCY